MPSWTDGRPTDRGDGGRKVLRPLCLFRAVPSLMWIGLVSTPGCGGARAGIEDTNAPSGARLITAEAIAKSGAKTAIDRKSTRLNSSHDQISYAVFCLKKQTACAKLQSERSGPSLLRAIVVLP